MKTPQAPSAVMALAFLFYTLFSQTVLAQESWQWQNPRPAGIEISDVQFADEMTGMAIGSFGTVFNTTDGGLTWQIHKVDVMLDLPGFWDLILLDAESGIAHGVHDVFLTRDGGITWRVIYSTDSPRHLPDCSFSSQNTIACLESDNIMLKYSVQRTVDGGVTWTRPTTSSVPLNGIFFVSDEVGWVVGAQGTILHTTDGGQTWDPQTSGTFKNLHTVEFVDEREGVAVGDDVFLYTSDAGTTWSRRSVPWAAESKNVDDVDWKGSSLVVVAEYSLYLTEDGGVSWRIVNDDSGTFGAAILNSNTIVTIGNGIHLTTDHGETWVPTFASEFFTHENLMDVWLTDRNTGIIVGSNGTILRTTDAGQTWVEHISGTESLLKAVAFQGPNEGVAVGEKTILRTTDGGITWAEATVPLQGNFWELNDVAFVGDDVIVAVGMKELAVGNKGVVLRSEDAGASWTIQYQTPLGESLRIVSLSDAGTGWAIGKDIVLETLDGGSTWVPTATEPPWYMGSSSFVDDITGYALDGHGFFTRILRTDNGGETWQFQLSVPWTLSGIYATDRDVAIVVGDNGKILRTESGGIATFIDAGPRIPDTPSAIALKQNYPNPFNPTTTISYDVSQLSHMTLVVFDLLGRPVRELASGTKPPGNYEVSFDATGLPSGIYFYRIQAGDYVETRRMVLVR